MNDLRVSKDLALPRSVVTHRQAFLGMSGSGKSNGLVVLAEEMFGAGLPWIFIDPKGDTYGIRSSGDGKKPGLDVPIFGGEHGDLPLPETSGERMGELVAADKVTGIFDLSGFETDASRARFMAAFGRALFRGRKTAIHVFCGECHEYMPQPGSAGRLDGPAADCVHVWKRILSQGRQKGIGVTLESQRAANVNKTCLTQCESLFAFRTVGRRDRDAIEAWVDSVGDAKEVLAALPRLADGECFVWSPTRLRIEQRFTFRRRSTYDSGRTPEVGEAVVVPKLADLDLGALRVELAALEPAEDGDAPSTPRTGGYPAQMAELRGKMAEIERELQAAHEGALPEASVARLEAAARSLQETGIAAVEAARDVMAALPGARPPRLVSSSVVHRDVKPAKQADQRDRVVSNGSGCAPSQESTNGAGFYLPKGDRAVLIAIAQHRDGVTREQLSVLTGYKRSSRDTYLQHLRQDGLVLEEGLRITTTPAGRKALGADWRPLPTGAKLRDHWLERLPAGERAVLEVLIAAHPKWVSREAIDKATGYKRSSRDTYIQKLRARRLATDAERGGVKASEELF